ncbi:MAG: hypothetical protein AOA65_1225 [Candidatus Bathyarchaeota archaeon BA1]|nr:MAG: hypothetical protein AOA65_1225 [Candidatus Bathyarchaeota archaeon BA1]
MVRLLEHEEVVERVENWLRSKYPPPKEIGEFLGRDRKADLFVYTTQKNREKRMHHHYYLQVKCKNSKDHHVGPTIGQCLLYYAFEDVLPRIWLYLKIIND